MAAIDVLFSEAVDSILKKVNFTKLKEHQLKLLELLVQGKDCVGILPTGYGKSLPYQLYLPVKREMSGKCDEKIIVCCPLLSLMDDQVKRLEAMAQVKPGYKGSDPDTDQKIIDGNIDIIFASPESLVGDVQFRAKLQNLDVSLIVIDEFHTIMTWGSLGTDDEKKAFRKWFRYVGELRSIFPTATLMALSATCTNDVKKQVLSSLNLENSVCISMSPNRQNIKYSVCRTEKTLETALFWLVEAINSCSTRELFPRIIIYCNSIKDVGDIFNFLSGELDSPVSFIDMYHSETPQDKKNAILSALRTKGNLRIVIATSALGMGVDIIDCYNTVLYGPPKNILDLIQQTGRCGRDGSSSLALILCNQYQIGHVDETVKDVTKTTKCRRQAILNHFLSSEELKNIEGDMNKHTCCDLCSERCDCGDCCSLPLEKMIKYEAVSHEMLAVSSSNDDTASSSSDTVSYTYESESDAGLTD